MEKRFPPSRKRLRKARQEGNLPKTRYLSQSAAFSAALLACGLMVAFAWVDVKLLLKYLFTEGFSDPLEAGRRCCGEALKVVVGVLGFGALVGVVLEVCQGGIFFEPCVVVPRADRLDPGRGVTRLVSSCKQAPLVFFRLLSIIALSYLWLGGVWRIARAAAINSYEHGLPVVAGELCGLAAWGVMILFAWGALEYLFRRKSWLNQVGMSLDDMRREHKEEEGDPMLRAMRRGMHEELAMHDKIERIRRSKVIIVSRSQS